MDSHNQWIVDVCQGRFQWAVLATIVNDVVVQDLKFAVEVKVQKLTETKLVVKVVDVGHLDDEVLVVDFSEDNEWIFGAEVVVEEIASKDIEVVEGHVSGIDEVDLVDLKERWLTLGEVDVSDCKWGNILFEREGWHWNSKSTFVWFF